MHKIRQITITIYTYYNAFKKNFQKNLKKKTKLKKIWIKLCYFTFVKYWLK